MKALSLILSLLFLSQLSYADTLLISITGQENPIDGEASWACRALDQNGNPYANKVVTAHASGDNGTDSFVAFTNSGGNAFFTYDPGGSGVDANKGYDEIYCAILDSGGNVLESSRPILSWRGEHLITVSLSQNVIDPEESVTVNIYLEDDFGDAIPDTLINISHSGANLQRLYGRLTDANGQHSLLLNTTGEIFPNTGTDVFTAQFFNPAIISDPVELIVKYKESLEIFWDLFADVQETYRPSCKVTDFVGNPIEGRYVTGIMSGPTGNRSANQETDSDGIREYYWDPNGGATPGTHNFYCRMTDSNGEDVFTETVSWEWIDLIKLDFKTFLIGPYNGIDMDANLTDHIPLSQPYSGAPWNYSGSESILEIPEDAVDWLLLSIRSAVEESSELGRQAVLLMKDGSIVNTDLQRPHFAGLFDQDVYVVIEHRNHLAAMTANGINEVNGIYPGNLSNQLAYENGTSSIQPGVFALWGGDGDHNALVSSFDLVNVWLPQNGGPAGYFDGDFNMDGIVTSFDLLNAWLPSNGNSSQVPD